MRDTRLHHWMLTLSWPVTNGWATYTATGTVQVPPGASRQAVYLGLADTTRRQAGVPHATHPTTMFFQLEPDAL